MTTVKGHLEQLQRNHKPEEVIAVQVWTTEDVIDDANNRDPPIKLTKLEAEEILEDIDRHQDASVGISWDTLDYYIDDHVKSKTT